MIRNERQYRVTSVQRKQLADALDELLAGGPTASADDPYPDQAEWRFKLVTDSLQGQIAILDEELREYEERFPEEW